MVIYVDDFAMLLQSGDAPVQGWNDASSSTNTVDHIFLLVMSRQRNGDDSCAILYRLTVCAYGLPGVHEILRSAFSSPQPTILLVFPTDIKLTGWPSNENHVHSDAMALAASPYPT